MFLSQTEPIADMHKVEWQLFTHIFKEATPFYMHKNVGINSNFECLLFPFPLSTDICFHMDKCESPLRLLSIYFQKCETPQQQTQPHQNQMSVREGRVYAYLSAYQKLLEFYSSYFQAPLVSRGRLLFKISPQVEIQGSGVWGPCWPLKGPFLPINVFRRHLLKNLLQSFQFWII